MPSSYCPCPLPISMTLGTEKSNKIEGRISVYTGHGFSGWSAVWYIHQHCEVSSVPSEPKSKQRSKRTTYKNPKKKRDLRLGAQGMLGLVTVHRYFHNGAG
jgi:hypothetical protein